MTVKGTLKYRKVERTPQVGSDAGTKGDNTGQGGGSSSSGTEEPGNEFD